MDGMEGVGLPGDWVDKARVFLELSEEHVARGVYRLSCFEAHQAAELYLKALLAASTGTHPYTHDLVELMDTLERLGFRVPGGLKLYGEALTPHYTLSRYPGGRPVTYNEERGRRCVELARAIVRWVEEVADP